ncbi:hypothetical protein Y032_0120g911 [Ancylostoma ceylanicum]|uniref:Uncharacterized protein n=1 Tax=Ancylostoma ceylanicum TaxID=53326 RepID=A0A016TAS6_9BILA|nr:hypothetical protein Y032_0120g911 [Ancylostoma ceylanicum]
MLHNCQPSNTREVWSRIHCGDEGKWVHLILLLFSSANCISEARSRVFILFREAMASRVARLRHLRHQVTRAFGPRTPLSACDRRERCPIARLTFNARGSHAMSV